MKSKKTDRVKRQIINSLEGGKNVIKIKICKAHKKNCYDAEIGDTPNMDMNDSKGCTGLSNFSMKVILKEIEDEMRSL